MFLCLALTLAPLALPLVAFLISVAATFGAPAYPVDIPAPVASEPAPVAASVSRPCRVARYEIRAYPLAECRAPHRSGVHGSVAVRYSGAPSYPALDVVAF